MMSGISYFAAVFKSNGSPSSENSKKRKRDLTASQSDADDQLSEVSSSVGNL